MPRTRFRGQSVSQRDFIPPIDFVSWPAVRIRYRHLARKIRSGNSVVAKSTKLTSDPIIEARAQKSVDNLRIHYERGLKANQDRERWSPSELATRLRTNPNTLRKERLFARKYTQRDFDKLVKLRRPDGMALHWGHVLCLITVRLKKDRNRLQQKAAKLNWSAAELYAAIRDNRPDDAGRGGRPIKVPQTTTAKLQLLITEGERWLRKYQAIVEAEDSAFLDELQVSDDPVEKELKGKLKDQLAEIGRVTNRTKKSLSGS